MAIVQSRWQRGSTYLVEVKTHGGDNAVASDWARGLDSAVDIWRGRDGGRIKAIHRALTAEELAELLQMK